MSAASLGSAGIIGAFFERLHTSTGLSYLPDIAFRLDSDQEIETIKWLGQVPAMREWVGGREPRAFRDNGFTIRNLKFESSIQVTLDEIRRDKTSQVMMRVNDLADRAASHPASLISTLILNGATGLCYDGQYFFDTDHTEGENSTNQSNSITFDISDGGAGGTTTNPTNLTMQRAILAGVAAMMAFKDDQNEPCNEFLTDFLVMVPPPLLAQGLAATVSPVSDSGSNESDRRAKQFPDPLRRQSAPDLDGQVRPVRPQRHAKAVHQPGRGRHHAFGQGRGQRLRARQRRPRIRRQARRQRRLWRLEEGLPGHLPGLVTPGEGTIQLRAPRTPFAGPGPFPFLSREDLPCHSAIASPRRPDSPFPPACRSS
jgi:hypothetical protein